MSSRVWLDAIHVIKTGVPRSPSLIVSVCGKSADQDCELCGAGDAPTRMTIENAVITDGGVLRYSPEAQT